jgi:four helix bundle protein
MNDEARTMNDIERRDLRKRTKSFALRIIKLYASLPKSTEAQVIGKQVLRSGTSVGAHYREAKRARSTAEFISKIECGLQELDETLYWLELLGESGIVTETRLNALKTEAEEIMKILVSSVKTAKKNR